MIAMLVNLVRLAGMQAVIALTAIARNKVLALRLGPDGYGEFIQLTLFVLAASTVAAFGMGMALNRNAAATSESRSRQRLLSQANSVNLTVSIVLTGVTALIVSLRPGTLGLLGLDANIEIVVGLVILLAVIPLDAAVQHRIGFLIGIEDIKGMTAGRSAALIAGTALSIPLVWFFGLLGAALQLALQTLLIVVLLDRRCRTLGYRAWGILFDKATFIQLAALGAASILAGVVAQLSDLVTRSLLVRVRDVTEGGIYQAALSLSHQVRAVVLGSVGSYLVTKFSQNTDPEVISETANKLLSVVQPIALLAFGLLGLFAGPTIVLLYSPAFLPAQQVISWLLLAYFFQVMVWVVGAPLLALNRVGVWLALELTFSLARLGLAVPFLPEYGMHAIATAYLAATIIHLVMNWLYVRWRLRIRIGGRHFIVMVIGAATIYALSGMGDMEAFGLAAAATGTLMLGAIMLGLLHLVVGIQRAWSSLCDLLVRRGSHG